MKIKLLFLFLAVLSGSAWAENGALSIQIAATKTATLAFYKQTTGFDSLYAEETTFGLVRIKQGFYSSRAEAEKVLVKVRNNGFPDAFISPYTGDSSVATTSYNPTPVVKSSYNKPLAASSSPAWSRLTAEQKQNVVYLDGALHIHENGQFTPLSKY